MWLSIFNLFIEQKYRKKVKFVHCLLESNRSIIHWIFDSFTLHTNKYQAVIIIDAKYLE